jgi:hypothetical protein
MRIVIREFMDERARSPASPTRTTCSTTRRWWTIRRACSPSAPAPTR